MRAQPHRQHQTSVLNGIHHGLHAIGNTSSFGQKIGGNHPALHQGIQQGRIRMLRKQASGRRPAGPGSPGLEQLPPIVVVQKRRGASQTRARPPIQGHSAAADRIRSHLHRQRGAQCRSSERAHDAPLQKGRTSLTIMTEAAATAWTLSPGSQRGPRRRATTQHQVVKVHRCCPAANFRRPERGHARLRCSQRTGGSDGLRSGVEPPRHRGP